MRAVSGRVTVSGTRAPELANRLEYAGVNLSRMTVVEDRRRALAIALAGLESAGQPTILAGYAPTMELRGLVRQRGGVGPLRDA
jgi:lipid II isoglutaminyl synthase (glutamine-hydrolysing)